MFDLERVVICVQVSDETRGCSQLLKWGQLISTYTRNFRPGTVSLIRGTILIVFRLLNEVDD